MLKEFKLNDKHDYIKGWYIDKNICKKLISFFEKNKKHQFKGVTGKGYDPKIKSSTDIAFSIHTNEKVVTDYGLKLKNCLQEYLKLYPALNNHLSPWAIVQDINLQKYKKKEAFFHWHCERANKDSSNRVLVFMTYLNTVDNGGETEWFYQKLKIKPETGLTLIWPVDWMFLHRGPPSITQEKYIITGWYSFLPN